MGLVKSEEEREEAIQKKVRKKFDGEYVYRRNNPKGEKIPIYIKQSRAAPDADERVSLPDPSKIGVISEDMYGRAEDGCFANGYSTPTAWGRCGNPCGSWPLTTFVEETDDYIVISCDAGCTVTLIKKPPAKKRPTKSLIIVNGEMVDSSSAKVPIDVPVDF